MKKILIVFPLFLTSCFCTAKKDFFHLFYSKEKNIYLVEMFNLPLECNEIIIEKDNKLFLKGKVIDKKVSIILPRKILNFGYNEFNLICNNSKYQISFHLSNYDVINSILYGRNSENIICKDYEDVLKTLNFIEEFKSYIKSEENNFKKLIRLLDCLTIEERLNVIENLLNSYDINLVVPYIIRNKSQFYSLPKFENIINLLLKSRDIEHQKIALEIIFDYPVKRFYERFFETINTNKIHLDDLINFVALNSSAEFSKEVFEFAKKKVVIGEFDNFIIEVFRIYSKKGEDKILFLYDLLKNKGLKNVNFIKEFIKELNITYEQSLQLLEYIENISDPELRLMVYYKLAPTLKDNPNFFKKFINFDDENLNLVLAKDINQLNFRYEHTEFVEFYKRLLIKNANMEVLNYFLNAPEKISKDSLKLYHMKNPNALDILASLKDIDFDYYLETILKCIKNLSCQNFEWSIMELAKYKERYFDILVDAYMNEKRRNNKIAILTAIASTGEKGAKFAYEKLLNNQDLKDNRLYREIAFYGDQSIAKSMLDKLFSLEKENVIGILEGFRDSKKAIQCEVLQKIYNETNDKDIRMNILWTWAWSCPDSYKEFIKVNKNTFDSVLQFDAIEAVVDIIENVKSEVKKDINVILNELYDLRKNKEIRAKITEVLEKYGTINDIHLIEKIMKDCIDSNEYETQKRLVALIEKLVLSK